MKNKRVLSSILALWLAVMSCNFPNVKAPTETPTEISPEQLLGTITALASITQTATFTAIPEISATPVPASATPCSAMIVANSAINVRTGPGTVYPSIGSIPNGGSAAVVGKNVESTWWYIDFPAGAGGHAWVSGSVTTASCLPATLPIIAAPPTPLPPSGTCRDTYVQRLINPGDKVCVSPASKAQADADNAAANSRKLITAYGSNACTIGYVWRGAFTGDVVCVTPATQSQAAADNAAAASRVDPGGASGPTSCIAGFVWREATAGDVVCVTVEVRTQTAADTAAASSRIAGAEECVSGYVWREAFSGDHVCVTPAVKTQVAADNAAAPSHTWP